MIPVLLLEKIREQIERTRHLLAYVPEDRLAWRPPTPPGAPEMRPLGNLIGHLLDCLAGFCAALYAAQPERLAHFMALRERPVNDVCPPEQAARRIDEYLKCIEEGFSVVSADDLLRRIPTVFVPHGEPLFTLLLGNLEHLINHKMQLFFYLRLLGAPVVTADLYGLRGV